MYSVMLSLVSACGFVSAADTLSWKDLRTVEQFARHCPDDLGRLFGSLDLSREDMADVAAAWKEGDKVTACGALLEFYRNGTQTSWYRKLKLQGSKQIVRLADEILDDRYTGMDQTGSVPRTREGHLKWAHCGPRNDWQFCLELNRHQHLMTLYRAWKETGKKAYIERLDQDLRDWMIAAGGQGAPFKTSHLEPAIRMPQWSRLFFALQQKKAFRPATRLLLLSYIPIHGEYLTKNKSGYNWATKTQLGALLAGVCWPQFKRAPVWRRSSLKTLQENLAMSVYPDGTQTELTSGYHLVSLQRSQEAVDLLKQAELEVPEAYAKLIRKMWSYVAGAIRPTGSLPLNNDSDLKDDRRYLRAIAQRCNRQDWLHIASNGKEGSAPAGHASRAYPWAGQLISRDGWGTKAQWSFFDFGPAGIGDHHHADHGHLSIQTGGKDVLVDSGRFAYQGKMARTYRTSYAKHTRGHNTIIIDGKGQRCTPDKTKAPAKAGTDYLIAPSFDFARAAWKNYEHLKGKATHYRALV